MLPPASPWMFQIAGPIIWIGLFVYFVSRAARTGQLQVAALLFFGGTTMFWQETYADWGGYVLFNPAFVMMPWWGHTPYTSPNKPLALVASYGWYFGPVLTLFLWLANSLYARRPRWGRFGAALIVTGPLFYLWDLGVEYFSTAMGWWEYVLTYGPALANNRSAFPAVYPIIPMTFSIVVMIWVVMLRGADGVWWHERPLGVAGAVPGAGREIRRVIAWAVTMNVVFFLLTTLPDIIIRILWTASTPLIP